MTAKKRLIIAITGASGAIYALRLLEIIKQQQDWESHLVVSTAGMMNLKHELTVNKQQLSELASYCYDVNNIAAPIASGSFKTDGMVIVPCSMKTLAAVAHGFADNLISRAADVMLKERRRLVLLPRETPLNLAHIRNMASVTEMGGIIFPPFPAFYHTGDTITAQIDETLGRVLVLAGMQDAALVKPWLGFKPDKVVDKN